MATKRPTGNGEREEESRAATENTERSAAAQEARKQEEGVQELDTDESRRRMRVLRRDDEDTREIDGLITAAAIGGAAVALETELLPGVLIGVGALLVGRMFPQIGGLVRPVLKTAIRAGYSLTDTARVAVAEASEQFRDVVAEVESERSSVRRRRDIDLGGPRRGALVRDEQAAT